MLKFMGKKFVGQQVKISLRKYDNIRKISTGQGNIYTTGYVLDYPYFKKYD